MVIKSCIDIISSTNVRYYRVDALCDFYSNRKGSEGWAGLSLNKRFDVCQPVDILLHKVVNKHNHTESRQTYLLLLVLSVLRNEQRQALVDSTLLDELLELFLDSDVKSIELRTNVKSTTFPVSLGGQFSTDRFVSVIREVVDNEGTVLADGINSKGTRSRVLQQN